MKRVAVIQPGYLPWLGFFELMASSDIFVVYDDVQFDKNGWRNRNRIKTTNGAVWLTIPVLIKGNNFPKINEVIIKDKKWRIKHLKTLMYSYSKAEYFNEIFPLIEKGLNLDTDRLVDIDMFFIKEIAKYLGINTEIVLSSDLKIEGTEKEERLINICKHFNATHYYNGIRGKELYKKENFLRHGIVLEIQDYKHPQYPQLYGDFVPYMSVIDILFNVGKSSLPVILSGRNILREW